MKTLTTAIATLLTATSAFAQYLEFDDISLSAGTISYGGADGIDALIGTDLLFDLVVGIGTPVTGPLQIIGGKLNFTTGPNISETPSVYTFSGGGSFTLTGTVIKPDLSVVALGTLLTGSFVGDQFVAGLGGGNGLFSGIGTDEKNLDLLAYYGLPPGLFEFATTGIGFAAAGLEPDGGFVATVGDSDLVNRGIPEPSTYAAGVAVCALILWRLSRRHQ